MEWISILIFMYGTVPYVPYVPYLFYLYNFTIFNFQFSFMLALFLLDRIRIIAYFVRLDGLDF